MSEKLTREGKKPSCEVPSESQKAVSRQNLPNAHRPVVRSSSALSVSIRCLSHSFLPQSATTLFAPQGVPKEKTKGMLRRFTLLRAQSPIFRPYLYGSAGVTIRFLHTLYPNLLSGSALRRTKIFSTIHSSKSFCVLLTNTWMLHRLTITV